MRGTERKVGFYEIIAERLSSDTSDIDDPRERGHLLEVDALNAFSEIYGKKVKTDTGVWVSDLDPSIALSPDGEISTAEAVEAKCLSSARHLQAYFEQKIPKDYEAQTIQYFIVNEKLKKLHVVFYDPRIESLPLHTIMIERKDVADTITAYTTQQVQTLKDITALITSLTF